MPRIALPCVLAIAALLAGGCDGGEPAAPGRKPGHSGERGPERGDGSAEPATPAVRVPTGQTPTPPEPGAPVRPAGGATLEGVVHFSGDPVPVATVVPVGTDPHYCGEAMSKQDIVIDPQSRGIRYTIVRLTGPGLEDWPGTRPGRLVLDNDRCRFVPHAAAVTVGSTLVVRNSDPVLHTTHLYGAATFNPALPAKGDEAQFKLRRPGLILVRCDKHGWMQAYLWVGRHPFHAVTDAQGAYRIAGIPAGRYTVEMWHEYFTAQKAEVELQAGRTARQDFTCTNEPPVDTRQEGESP